MMKKRVADTKAHKRKQKQKKEQKNTLNDIAFKICSQASNTKMINLFAPLELYYQGTVV